MSHWAWCHIAVWVTHLVRKCNELFSSQRLKLRIKKCTDCFQGQWVFDPHVNHELGKLDSVLPCWIRKIRLSLVSEHLPFLPALWLKEENLKDREVRGAESLDGAVIKCSWPPGRQKEGSPLLFTLRAHSAHIAVPCTALHRCWGLWKHTLHVICILFSGLNGAPDR